MCSIYCGRTFTHDQAWGPTNMALHWAWKLLWRCKTLKNQCLFKGEALSEVVQRKIYQPKMQRIENRWVGKHWLTERVVCNCKKRCQDSIIVSNTWIWTKRGLFSSLQSQHKYVCYPAKNSPALKLLSVHSWGVKTRSASHSRGCSVMNMIILFNSKHYLYPWCRNYVSEQLKSK